MFGHNMFRARKTVSRNSLAEYMPHCAVCNRSVDRITEILSEDSMYMVYKVECHGQTEETRIGYEDIASAPIKITGGVAFNRQLIGTSCDNDSSDP